jgi:hypothetical protein
MKDKKDDDDENLNIWTSFSHAAFIFNRSRTSDKMMANFIGERNFPRVLSSLSAPCVVFWIAECWAKLIVVVVIRSARES